MKRFNKSEWLGFIFLMGLTLYLGYLLRKGNIVSYIHPKRIPLMWAALGGLILLMGYQSMKVFTTPSRKTNYLSYLPLGFLILCSIMTLTLQETDRFSPGKVQSSVVAAAGTKERVEKILPDEKSGEENNTSQEAFNPDSGQEDLYEPSLNSEREENKTEDYRLLEKIELNSDNYTKIISDIEQNPEKYIGKKIKLEGFVYRDPQFDEDEFVIARMYMLCCAADAQVTGLMCRWDKSTIVRDEQWIVAEGVLMCEDYEIDGGTSRIPVIQLSKVTKLKTPENQYIYY